MTGETRFVLNYVSDSTQPAEKPLLDGIHILGRDSKCAIVLDGQNISRNHALLEIHNGEAWLMDLGSANGTQLDGHPLLPRHKVPLAAKQIFSIGGYQLEILPPGQKPSPKSSARFVVRYAEGAKQGREMPLKDGEYTIGREPACSLMLEADEISRRHAQITIQGDKAWITDLGSTNGISCNGKRLAPQQRKEITTGDRFEMGPFQVEVVPAAQAARAGAIRSLPVDEAAPATMVYTKEQLPVLEGMQPLNLGENEKATLGRAADNTIVLDHPGISRYHAAIERLGSRYRLLDLHSSNGVFLNGERVDNTAWLKESDQIKIGPYQFTFTVGALQAKASEGYSIQGLHINKKINRKINLLKNISISIASNEFVAIVGTSGSGKTTLMNTLNGFRPATSGQILVNEVNLYQNPDMFRSEIGYVPQRDIVHQELTPDQALGYAAQLRMPPDTTKEERQEAVTWVLEELGLADRRHLPISRLSGGQIKRVSIGVELINKPHLFFLDEPTSGLDPVTEYEMMKTLRRLADQGRTILLVTHTTKNVMLCDKVVILTQGGYLAFFGPPEEALVYFDRYRTLRERREKDIEFDAIYNILEDPQRGTPAEWAERFQEHLASIGPKTAPALQAPAGQKGQAEAKPASRPHPRSRPRRVSGLRQFVILSSRNLKVLTQDRVSLILLLVLAPAVGAMNFIWGNNSFDPVNGNFFNVIQMWFMTAFIGMLVGSLGSVREIVKENDIYRRERTVGLKIMPYILSKVWVGAVISIYQGAAYLLLVALMVRPTVPGFATYLPLLFTMSLGILCGYLMGLVISAAVPNQNSALIVLIAVVVPQLLFAGVLLPLKSIPLGETISYGISTRWTFEAFLRLPGTGDALASDACWALPDDQRSDLTDEQKANCPCMGANIFTSCATIPGILDSDRWNAESQAALARPEPIKPAEPTHLPSPTPLPTLTPVTMPADIYQMQTYQQAVQAQAAEYMDAQLNQLDSYTQGIQDQYQEYVDQIEDYTTDEEDWQTQRETTIGSAERTLERILNLYDPAFRGTIPSRWWNLALIAAGLLVLIFVFQKLKDYAR